MPMTGSYNIRIPDSFFLIVMASLSMSFCFGLGCIDSERTALLQLKDGLADPSNRLSDWVSNNSNCCQWTGVVCHDITHHVIELHLQTLSPQEFIGQTYLLYYDNQEYEEYNAKFAFSGQISPSLLHLKHLTLLDLSNNNFQGVSVPRFLGLMQSLRFLNLSQARFGGIVPPQLGNLSNLQYLNLHSSQKYDLKVENFDWISSLSSLHFLDLSSIHLGKASHWLKVVNSLPSLIELHLSNCNLSSSNPLLKPNSSFLAIIDLSNNKLQGPIPSCFQNISSLRELDLSFNNLNSSIPSWLYSLSHLQVLNLRFNSLQGRISNAIGNMTSLTSLELSYNDDQLEFEHGFPSSFKNFCNLRSLRLRSVNLNTEIDKVLEILSSECVSNGLELLDLGGDQLSGQLTDHLGHLKKLRYLWLKSDSKVHGPLPRTLERLCNLRSMSMVGVQLNQEISEILEMLSNCASSSIHSLFMSGCQLSGHLIDHLSQFKNLADFSLPYNSISGPLPMSLGDMSSLKSLYLTGNQINGTLPLSFGRLAKLQEVYMHNNLLEGEVSEIHFANLTKLSAFLAPQMGKNVSLRVSPNWIPSLELDELDLRSWHLGPKFPNWVRFLPNMSFLDLSNSGISGTIPNWFWDVYSNCRKLNLSQNKLHGIIPNVPSFGNIYSSVDLSSNNFSGPVPEFSPSLSALDLSSNSFSGSISNFLCSNLDVVKQMQVLNLEGNNLSSEIPDCFVSWKHLIAMKLNNNKFKGKIPDSMGALSLLEYLRLGKNSLSGEIPWSLQNCSSLITLDLGGNELVGNIPNWLGAYFSSLKILNLRGNKLEGRLPNELCHLASLHILDLAENSFSGIIPRCFENFNAMAVKNDSESKLYFHQSTYWSYMESALLVMKGKVMQYSTILGFVRIIDISNNNLSGEIPKEITRLAALQSLNLSQNALTGKIPDDIWNMQRIESIDFSENQLSGKIPESISKLTFLSHLNLSHNKLSGKIPSGTQLQSLGASSFMGNQLCGLPLTNSCSSDSVPTDSANEEENENNGIEVDVWFYASMTFGFVIGFWIVVGSLILKRSWRQHYFHFVDNLGDKIRWGVVYKLFKK